MARPSHASVIQRRERTGSIMSAAMTKKMVVKTIMKTENVRANGQKLMFLVSSWDNSMTIFAHFQKNKHLLYSLFSH